MHFILSNPLKVYLNVLFSLVSHIPTYGVLSTAAINCRRVSSVVRHGALCPASARPVRYNIAFASIQWKAVRYIKVCGEIFSGNITTLCGYVNVNTESIDVF